MSKPSRRLDYDPTKTIGLVTRDSLDEALSETLENGVRGMSLGVVSLEFGAKEQFSTPNFQLQTLPTPPLCR
jgi:hypothetical protein